MRRGNVTHECLMEQFEVKGVKLRQFHISSPSPSGRQTRRLNLPAQRRAPMSPNYQSVPLGLLMRPLAAKLLLRLDSSAKSGDVFNPHVLSGCASTLLVSSFYFRLSYFHVACQELQCDKTQNLKDQLTAAKRLLLCCTIAGISFEVDCELLFVAVGQFRDVAPFTEPSMPDPDPLFDRPLIAMVGASVGSSWCACVCHQNMNTLAFSCL